MKKALINPEDQERYGQYAYRPKVMTQLSEDSSNLRQTKISGSKSLHATKGTN